jgi:signal transduction histidine kinase/CheY-like chemotaxis protein
MNIAGLQGACELGIIPAYFVLAGVLLRGGWTDIRRMYCLTRIAAAFMLLRAVSLTVSACTESLLPVRFAINVCSLIGAWVAVLFVSALATEWTAFQQTISSLKTDIQEQAATSLRNKDELLAFLCHSLRNPIQVLTLAVESLQSTTIPNRHLSQSEQEETLSSLRFVASHISMIIDDVLTLTKLQKGQVFANTCRVQLHDCFGTVIRVYESLAVGKGLTFNHTIDEQVPSVVRSDPSILSRILSGIVGNAVKFTEKGRIDVGLHMTEDKAPDRIAVQLHVTDTGHGMDEAKIRVVFEPYNPASLTITEDGSGLGLAIVKLLLGVIGGSITCQSALNVGTEVTAYIPMELCGPPEQQKEREHIEPVSGKQRLLVVDDSVMICKLMERILRQMGYEVDRARGGAEAIKAMQLRTYTLVFMDVYMPGMSGLEATRQLRAIGCSIPIVAISANASPEDKQAAEDAGVTDFLPKPVTRLLLSNVLRTHLRRATGTGGGRGAHGGDGEVNISRRRGSRSW